ncbi:MAG: Gfo/Idh/MocA family protein, partial [Planctomycetota bacterium]
MSNGTSTATIRLGAIGLGWIGLQRLLRVRDTALPGGSLDIVSLCDCSDEALHIACEAMPQAWACQDLEEMLSFDLDGILIATPSALHAAQAQRCLEAGTAVFCQKPLARDASEARQVIDAARLNDRLLGVDFSYRHLRASEQLKTAIQSGSIGTIYAMDLIFHNAYGPDKEWFYDIERSGGGCMMDLGIHLFDLALWCLDFPDIANVAGRRWHQGRALAPGERTVEDYATATMLLADGAECRCTTSWNMHAGRDAVIEAHVHGRDGGLSLTNIGGSF